RYTSNIDHEYTSDLDQAFDNDILEDVEVSTSMFRRKAIENFIKELSVKKIRVKFNNPNRSNKKN
ncbi:18163_t:CDS:1, partial [Cetraspora pellucida]